MIDAFEVETEIHFTCQPNTFAVFAHDKDLNYGNYASDKQNILKKDLNIITLLDDCNSSDHLTVLRKEHPDILPNMIKSQNISY